MFESHSRLTLPPDDAVLWRYMDFPKFLAIVARRELYFVSLPNLPDPFEGHMPRPMVDSIRSLQPSDDDCDTGWGGPEKTIRVMKDFRQTINISCCHMNDIESDAMWQLYMPRGQGIAIRTTFDLFCKAFSETSTNVFGGIVEYVDYETHEVESNNIFNWSILKRKSFAHENEFRGIVMDPCDNGLGVNVAVNGATLIDSVFVSPLAPTWHVDLLRTLLMQHELYVPVKQSKLYHHPAYLTEPAPDEST